MMTPTLFSVFRSTAAATLLALVSGAEALSAAEPAGGVNSKQALVAQVIQTSRDGRKAEPVGALRFVDRDSGSAATKILLIPEHIYQRIEGFGGATTEASASVLNQLSPSLRAVVIKAYFDPNEAAYSLIRTHINSCDFSLSSYSYADTPDDFELKHFDIAPDKADIIPLIKDAMTAAGGSLKVMASPWSPPAWMKTTNHMLNGGSLKPECYAVWALYFSKYIKAYAAEGIPIWAVTVQNEPGSAQTWESCQYTAKTEAEFVGKYLGPRFAADGIDSKIIIFDHNADAMSAWLDDSYANAEASKYIWGSAVHWYASTSHSFESVLSGVHAKYPDKAIIHTEACIDDDRPGTSDAWFWDKKATDWGYNQKLPEHPIYVPVYRYANDIINKLNHWVTGWIDWNLVLNTEGGPNHQKNWCNAPVVVDVKAGTVYYTPLYYVMKQFSKYMRPGAHRIGVEHKATQLNVTAVKNPASGLQANTIAVQILNHGDTACEYQIEIQGKFAVGSIPAAALQTVVIPVAALPSAEALVDAQ